MAIVKNNPVTQGFSGMLNDLIVFRQLRGKTIVAKRPKPARRQSDLQKANRRRFHDATVFAKAAMYDPKKKAYYWQLAHEQGLPNAYTAAITEYMRRGKSSQSTAKENRLLTPVLVTTSRPLTHYPAFSQPAVNSGLWTVDYSATSWLWTSTQHIPEQHHSHT